MSGLTSDDYFIHPHTRSPAPGASRLTVHEPQGVGQRGKTLPFASGSGRPTQAVMAVLFGVGGLVLGAGGPFLLYVAFSIMSWGASPGPAAFYIALGVVIAVLGVAGAVLIWLPWREAPALLLDDGEVRVRYPGFGRPLVVPRALVRAVAIDDRPVHLFHRNDRFPVEGNVPEGSYVDALDVHPADPWQPNDPSSAVRFPIPSPLSKPQHTYLFSADGSALPALRVNPGDVPNVAILLHEPVSTPRPPIGAFLMSQCAAFYGGRRIRGLVLRAADATAVAGAFHSWGVVRPITAEDVAAEHLSLPKPLKGVRAFVYGALLLIPVLLRIVFRHRI